MLKNSPFYAGVAFEDLSRAKDFYGSTLGVEVIEIDEGLMILRAANGYSVLVYEKPGHRPAEHTVLNFPVDDIETTVDRMTAAGVTFEQYDSGPLKTDAKGIAQPGPKQAWFKDPAGNILSVIEG
ncbi:VOC family protein [Plantactinospora sp. GCM10030261]|uniref:VOC family protein n=1 Tax=Plantactinospora sp. GCM10030261 TaxID=3273420 RepID=UPI00360D98E3